MTLFEEVKRRNVFRVAMAYAVMSWLVIQVADAAVPALKIPEWVNSLIFLLLALGFIPTLIFAWAFELTPEGVKRQSEVDRSQSITGETGKKLNYVTIAALLAAIAVVGADRFLFPDQAAPIADPSGTDQVSIAVLPFADMSPDKDQDYFSDGITEEILNGLAKLRTMKVAGRTSSFAFKGRNEDLRDIGAALGVQHVLEGSVRKDGDRLRITAQLIKVSDGFHLWSETYDRQLRDVFAVQDEISTAIVKELQGNLLGDDGGNSPTREIDVRVYERYLAARKKIVARSNASLTEARAILEEVVAAEPDFPPALSSLAETVVLLRGETFFAYGDLDPAEVREIANPLLDRAIELDPNFADAFAVRGLMLDQDAKRDEAEASLLRAVELNPSLSNAWNWLGNSAGYRGRIDDSIDYYQQATTVDPLWIVPNSNLIRIYGDQGRLDDARAIVERLRPFHISAANFHAIDAALKQETGQLADALLAYRKAYDLAPDTPSISSQTAFLLADLQNGAEALEVVPPQFFMLKNNLTGQWDEALPVFRDAMGDDPLGSIALWAYLRGATYVGDYESIVEFYDAHIQSVTAVEERGREDLLLMFVPAMEALGRIDERDQMLDAYRRALLDKERQGVVDADIDDDWASYHAFAGNYDEAMGRLEQAFAKGSRWNGWAYHPEFDPMMDDPRFVALNEKNRDAINSERGKLGWEPVAVIGEFISVD